MASGKARSTKRSSATSSYSSATTIVIFVGLSVLGLWLLTSNSLAPPQSTTPTTATKTLTRIASIGHTHHSNLLPQTRDNEKDDKADEAVIEPETKIENDEEQTDNGAQTEATLIDHEDTKGSDDKDSTDEQEKQAALETQTSEESSITQKVVEQIIEENSNSEAKVETNDQESNTNHGAEDITTEGGSLTQSSETTDNQITDEDQQQRIDEHQQREDEQNQQGEHEAQSKDPNGAISHDQIQHDEAPILPHQDGSRSEATDQETKHDSLDENRDKATLSPKMNEETSNKNDEASNSNGDNSGIPEESTESKNSWTTQAHQSEDQKERRKTGSNDKENSNHRYTWLLCNVTAGADYIPCLDNEKVIANIHSRLHHEHRERHCPEDPTTCLVPLTHHWQNIRGTRTG